MESHALPRAPEENQQMQLDKYVTAAIDHKAPSGSALAVMYSRTAEAGMQSDG